MCRSIAVTLPKPAVAGEAGLGSAIVPGALVGELAFTMLKDQFEKLRDGDRFWYAGDLSDIERGWLEVTTLADIIRRNTTIGEELPDDVFHLSDRSE